MVKNHAAWVAKFSSVSRAVLLNQTREVGFWRNPVLHECVSAPLPESGSPVQKAD